MIHCKVNILGTEYTIKTVKKEETAILKENNFAAVCGEFDKEIWISDENDFDSEKEKENWRKTTLRHEVFHAFLNESGLSAASLPSEKGWARNEEMVDWFAIQSPKIYKVFAELDIL